MLEAAVEVRGLEGAQEADPAGVELVQEHQGRLDRAAACVWQLGPSFLIVRPDGWLILGQGELVAYVGIHVAVRQVVSYLAHCPPVRSIRRVQLGVGQVSHGLAERRRVGFDLVDPGPELIGSHRLREGEVADRIPEVFAHWRSLPAVGRATNRRMVLRARRVDRSISKPAFVTAASVLRFGWQPPAMAVHTGWVRSWILPSVAG